MLCFAAITPHPPIIIPEIGQEDVVVTEKTINAMLQLSLAFAVSKPDIVVVISPHAILLHDRIGVYYGTTLKGNFGPFGHIEVEQEYENDKAFVDILVQKSFLHQIQIDAYSHKGNTLNLDHGALVPLYYLSKAYSNFNLVLSSFSDFEIMKHFEYGQALKETIDQTEKRVAVIASGDLSHRLKKDGPYGFDPAGPKFDYELVELLREKNMEKIVQMDPELVDESGECVYRSIVTLLGLLGDTDFTPEVLSYEGPWGVGYLVANMQLESKKLKD